MQLLCATNLCTYIMQLLYFVHLVWAATLDGNYSGLQCQQQRFRRNWESDSNVHVKFKARTEDDGCLLI